MSNQKLNNQNSTVQVVLSLLEQGDYVAAFDLCQSLVQQQPTNADVWHLWGLVHAQRGDFTQAVSFFERAIKLDGQQAAFYFNLSNAYKRLGKLDLALRYLHIGLELQPNHAQGHNNLGSLFYTQGRFTEAIPAFTKAIRLDPHSWEAHYNLANCLVKCEQVLQAISHYRHTLQLHPNHLNAKTNLAMCLVEQHDYAASLPYLEEIAQLNLHHAELQGHLAQAYLEVGKSDKAIKQFEHALSLEPNRHEWQHNLGVLYLREQNYAAALNCFKRAVDLQPKDVTAQHMVNALEGRNSSDRPPRDYIRDLFDQYATYYDTHVKQQLNYQVPALLRQTFSKFITPFTSQMRILDIGCGTGMCGVYFRDLARFMVGVDLSWQMLLEAKKLGAYDGLCCADILEFIPGEELKNFDLIIAADVLVYIGALDVLFSKLKSCLGEHGKIIFTCEISDQNIDYKLLSSGRYAHSVDYIQRACGMHGLEIIDTEKIVLRTHNQEPVNGTLFVISINSELD